MNEQETIDGIKGEWRTVARPEEVTVGQRVRYDGCGAKKGDKRTIRQIAHGAVITETGFSTITSWRKFEAFFPLTVKPAKRKVAKITIEWSNGGLLYKTTIGRAYCYSPIRYATEKSAIRGARRFCAAIGYECEIVK